MSVERPKPHVFEDTHIWMRQVSQGWQFKPPADLHCSVEPGQDVWEGEWTDDSPLDPIAPTFDYDRPFVFYYMHVTQGNYQHAWASPIWLTEEKA